MRAPAKKRAETLGKFVCNIKGGFTVLRQCPQNTRILAPDTVIFEISNDLHKTKR
jgi:hypothetical protein